VLKSIHTEELDLRRDQIDENLGSTFEWVFQNPRVGLKDWLRLFRIPPLHTAR